MLYTYQAGPPKAPAIVFLHGGGLSCRMWQPQFDQLDDFFCLAPDLPEHGQSRARRPFRLDDAARQVADLIHAKVPARKAHLVGLSLGGAVVLTLLRLEPAAVDHAFVSGTTAGLAKWSGRFSLATLPLLRFSRPEKLARAQARHQGIPPEYQQLFEKDLLRATSEAFNRNLIEELMRMQLPDQIEAPLLVAVGGRETLPAKQAALRLVTIYPQARGVLAPGLGHVWNLQNPYLFANTVRAWVTGDSLPTLLQRLRR
jgi:pimeloyl-ACP methyl ester carboxylesterase